MGIWSRKCTRQASAAGPASRISDVTLFCSSAQQLTQRGEASTGTLDGASLESLHRNEVNSAVPSPAGGCALLEQLAHVGSPAAAGLYSAQILLTDILLIQSAWMSLMVFISLTFVAISPGRCLLTEGIGEEFVLLSPRKPPITT